MRTLFPSAVVVAVLCLATTGADRARGQQYGYYATPWTSVPPVSTSAPFIRGSGVVYMAPTYYASPLVYYRVAPTYQPPRVSYWAPTYSTYPSSSAFASGAQWSYYPRVQTWSYRPNWSSVESPSYAATGGRHRGGLQRYYEWKYNPRAPGGPNH
jgi:hypothetical protein